MPEFSRNMAFAIGINNYGNGISPLQNAANDAKKLVEILREKHGYHVWVCFDEVATLQTLKKLLEETLPQEIQPDDRLLFYFAGHGIALNDDEGPQGYLIPYDAILGDTKTYLPMTQVHECLSELSCRHFLGILDCCFAGAFRWSSTRNVINAPRVLHKERYDRFITDPAWQVITSAADDQKALDAFNLDNSRGQVGGHSLFATALFEALAGAADLYPPAAHGHSSGDGVITATELYLYLRDRVEGGTIAHHLRQTPGIWALNKHDKGEYIFLTPEHELNLPPAPPLDESQNPYRGLESFDEEHSHLFFGRQELTEKLYQHILKQPLTVVLGASGTGKSSLVKAGLIPYVKKTPLQLPPQAGGEIQQWRVLHPIRLGESPLQALRNTLVEEKLLVPGNPVSKTETGFLLSSIDRWISENKNSKLLLVFDQFEESITLCQNDQERENFLSLLVELVSKYSGDLRIVLTLRTDFESQLRNLALEPYLTPARFIVPMMTREELRSCIEEPATSRVMYFEPHSLVDNLIDEVMQMPGALPLLSFTLSELYLKYLENVRKCSTDNRAITQEDYEQLGGVTRSLTQRADSEYRELVQQEPAYAQTIRNVMLRMVAVGGTELARRRVPISELEYPEPEQGRVQEVIKRFCAARLLVQGQDTEGKPYVEPAHDALVNGWQKLLSWQKESEDNLILQRRLTPAAEEWKSKQPTGSKDNFAPLRMVLDKSFYFTDNLVNKIGNQFKRSRRRTSTSQERSNQKQEQFLWDDNPYLNVLNEKLNSSDNWFNQLEAEFVRQSVRKKHRDTGMFESITFAVILGLSTLLVISIFNLGNSYLNESGQSNETATFSLNSSNDLEGMLQSLQAAKILSNPLLLLFPAKSKLQEQIEGTLLTAVYTVKEQNRLEAAERRPFRSVSFSPNGNLLASSSDDGNIRLWDTQNQPREWKAGLGSIRSISFSPDSQRLVSAGDDRQLLESGFLN